MKFNQELLNEIAELVVLSMENDITKEQLQRLESLLEGDPIARKYYFRLINTYWGLQEPDNLKVLHDKGHEAPYDIELWKALAEIEATAPGIHIERPSEKTDDSDMIVDAKPGHKISKMSIFTLVFSAAAILFITVLVIFFPSPPVVATLTDSINAEWVNIKEIPSNGDVLRKGEMTLIRGLAEVTFDDGAVVVVEAPAVIKLVSPKSMFVSSGKVSAFVSEYATGFTVNTPSASIVDLGTEFGVSVKYDGSCDLHMFRGKANLVVGQEGQKRTTQIVEVDQARSVDRRASQIRDISLQKNDFVRRIDSQNGFVWRGQNLDIADVVGGGNGFGTGRYGSGIDLDSGNPNSYMNYIDNRPGHDQYLEVPGNDWIDGVFIPDGGNGDVQIDSSGNTFAACPDTSGVYWTQIANSGIVAIENQTRHHSVLDGLEYGTIKNPSIIMVPNVGITFDLNNIRKDMPGVDISQFTAKCGLSETLQGEFDEDSAKAVISDFWVFIDGEKRFEAKGVSSISGPKDILLDIQPEDRFLTLIVTDGDMTIGHDWCLFGDPKLILESGQ